MLFHRLVLPVLLVGCSSAFWSASSFAEEAPASRKAAKAISGREIFLREWLPNDPRSHGGDGLGPVFNETSCVACHNQGGVGGSGSEGKNVNVISSIRVPNQAELQALQQKAAAEAQATQAGGQKPQPQAGDLTAFVAQSLEAGRKLGSEPIQKPKPLSDEERKTQLAALKELHPGLATTRSVVLHRSSIDANYSEWRQKLMLGAEMFDQLAMMAGAPGLASRNLGGIPTPQSALSGLLQVTPPREMSVERTSSLTDTFMSHPTFRAQLGLRGNRDGKTPMFGIQVSQRNTTSLFGAGLIDSIPEAVIVAAAEQDHPEYPPATGRVARTKDNKVGRFGWKSQKASLYDFTMTACAVELGLNVPDHRQAGSPQRPDYQPAGFDLNQAECDALVKYLKELPAPVAATTDNAGVRESLKNGERLFAKIGCAACHTQKLGDVAGIFSDLLVHDMGPDGGDSGDYGVFVPESTPSDSEDPIPEVNAVQIQQIQGGRFAAPNSQTLQVIPENLKGAATQEWRTAPLWGVRDSGPYLHDGRAKTLEQAIAMHGGEGQQSAMNFYSLSKTDQTLVLAFLRSLVAPDAIAAAQ